MKKKSQAKPENREQAADAGVDRSGLTHLQNQVGNWAVQRVLV